MTNDPADTPAAGEVVAGIAEASDYPGKAAEKVAAELCISFGEAQALVRRWAGQVKSDPAHKEPAAPEATEARLAALEWALLRLIEWSDAGQAMAAEVERLRNCGRADKGAVTRDA